MREWLGPDDPIVRALLAKDSPDTLAARLVAARSSPIRSCAGAVEGGAAALEARTTR